MNLLALILGAVLSGQTIIEYGKQPIDVRPVEQFSTQQNAWASEENQQQWELVFLEWTATWYDYQLNWNRWSKTHNTCAIRQKERYWLYKVCSKTTGKCVVCKHNDYGPQREDRVIDLSSHAFKELWVPLSRGVTKVLVYKVN